MSRRALPTLAALAILPAALAAQQPTFKAGTQVVPLYVTVVDTAKRLVPDLAQEDFEVLDNGKPVTLSLFNNEPEAFSVVVMLDTSASMTASLDLLKDAAEQFVIRLLPEDRGMVGAFSDKIQFPIATFTSDRDEMAGALKDLGFGNPTRLYDAIEASIQQLRDVQGRRVVLVFTDGDDTASRRDMGDALLKARQTETMIYAIGLESEIAIAPGRMQRTRPDRGLRKLAEETGGGYFELKKTAELAPTFTRVAAELHSLYTLGFTPTAFDNKEHKLEVKMKTTGQSARARKSYIASADRLSGTK
jgi:Ca-activated chloride channel family protein